MERTKHGIFVFPPKKTLIWRRHCSIDQSCCSMTSKQFLESSSGMKFVYPSVRLANQKQRCVCIRFIHQSNRSISVRLLFLFCSRVFTKIALTSTLPLANSPRSPPRHRHCHHQDNHHKQCNRCLSDCPLISLEQKFMHMTGSMI